MLLLFAIHYLISRGEKRASVKRSQAEANNST